MKVSAYRIETIGIGIRKEDKKFPKDRKIKEVKACEEKIIPNP